MMNQPTLFIFDFDGVIAEGSNEAYFDCYHQAVKSVGVSLDPAREYERMIEKWGMGERPQLEWILQEYPEKVDQAVQTWNACVSSDSFWGRIHFFSDVKEVFAEIERRGCLYAIVSGTRKEFIAALFHREGFQHTPPIFSSADIPDARLRKPDPYTLNLALDHFSVHPEDAVYIGDMKNDVMMARAGGVEPVVVLTGGLTEQQAQALDVRFVAPHLQSVVGLFFKN